MVSQYVALLLLTLIAFVLTLFKGKAQPPPDGNGEPPPNGDGEPPPNGEEPPSQSLFFTDFENGIPSSVWVETQVPPSSQGQGYPEGVITLSTEQAHSGTHSVKMYSQQGGPAGRCRLNVNVTRRKLCRAHVWVYIQEWHGYIQILRFWSDDPSDLRSFGAGNYVARLQIYPNSIKMILGKHSDEATRPSVEVIQNYTFQTNRWYKISMEYFISASSGEFNAFVDDTLALHWAGDTATGYCNYITQVRAGIVLYQNGVSDRLPATIYIDDYSIEGSGGNGGNGGDVPPSPANAEIVMDLESGTFSPSNATGNYINTWSNGIAEVIPEARHTGNYGYRCTALVTERWFGDTGEGTWGGARARIWWESQFKDRSGNLIRTREFYVRQYIRVRDCNVRNGIEFMRFHTIDSGVKSGYVARFFLRPDGNGFRFSVNLGSTNDAYIAWFPNNLSDVAKMDFGSGLQFLQWYCLEVRVNVTGSGGVQAWIDGVQVLNTIGQYNCSSLPGTISNMQLGIITSSPTGAVIGQKVIYDADDIAMGYNRIGA